MHNFRWAVPILFCVIVVLCFVAAPGIQSQGGIQQPAHVLGAFSTNDCAKINVKGFLVSNGTGCGAGAGFVTTGVTLTANTPVFGNGGVDVVVGTVTGNTTKLVSNTGTNTSGRCTQWDASGNLVQAAGPCGTGSAQVFTFGGGFVNGGSTITATIALPVTAPAACTIIAWELSIPAADTGTATVKFLKIAAGTASPAIANSINTSGVALASGTHIRSTTLTDFTSLVVTAGDIIAADLITVGGAPTGLTASVECQ